MTSSVKRTTANLDLKIPVFDTPQWGRHIEGNFDVIDALIYALSGYSNIQGVWEQGIAYTVGQRVVDSDLGTLWECKVNHTSASSGTFAQDRTANPTYWTSWQFLATAGGTWAPTTGYSANTFLVNSTGYKYGVVKESYISGATSFEADVTNGDIILLVDLTSSVTTATNAASNASTSETNAATSAANASTSETNASNSAASASVSASNASTSATNAGNSETAAGTSASNASASETNAANSAAAALASQNAAATSAAVVAQFTDEGAISGAIPAVSNGYYQMSGATATLPDAAALPVGFTITVRTYGTIASYQSNSISGYSATQKIAINGRTLLSLQTVYVAANELLRFIWTGTEWLMDVMNNGTHDALVGSHNGTTYNSTHAVWTAAPINTYSAQAYSTGSPQEIHIPVSGMWEFSGGMFFNGTSFPASGFITMRILLNGSEYIQGHYNDTYIFTTSPGNRVTVNQAVRCNAGDILRVEYVSTNVAVYFFTGYTRQNASYLGR